MYFWDKLAPFKNKILAILKKIKNLKIRARLSRKNIIIIASAFVAVLLAAAAAYYYYFYIYLAPNFEDELYNNVVTATMESVSPGEDIIYRVNYKNVGYREVDKLKISVEIPEGVTVESSGESGTYSEGNRILQYIIESIPRGSSGSLEFKVKVKDPLDNGTVIDFGKVRFDYFIGEESFDRALDAGEGHIVESSPDFSSFSISSLDINGGFLGLDDEIQYTVKIRNTGNMIARDVEIKSRLSEYLSLVEGSVNYGGKYIDGDVSWKFEELEPGQSRTMIFKARLENGEVQDKEEIKSNAVLLYKGKEEAEEEIADLVRLFPDFSETEVTLADANGGGYLWANETVSVKITIKNTGQREAGDYKLFCPIPDQAVYISNSGTPEGIEWSDDIRGLIWSLNGLEVGETKEIRFNMAVKDYYYYRSGTITTDFHIAAGDDEFVFDPKSIYIQGHIYLNVVAMGDSLIARSDWVQRLDSKLEAAYPYADYNTVPSAVSGEMSFEGLARFDSTVGPLQPHILIVAYGTNDTGISLSYFQYSIENIVARAKGMGATVFINLVGPISRAGKEDWPKYDGAIRQVAAKYGVPVIDVVTPLSQNQGKYLSDGMHYTPSGAEVVAQTVFNSIVQYLNGLGGRR